MTRTNRVTVLGAGGQIGRAVASAYRAVPGTAVSTPERSDVDLTDESAVSRHVEAFRPDLVVNAAAAMPADLCERDPRLAVEVNVIGALHVAQAAQRSDARCVYVSTDFVFDGSSEGEYGPEDPAHPMQTYGMTKLAGEKVTREACRQSVVVRTSSVFGPPGSRGGQFVDRMLTKLTQGETLDIVDDVVMRPTYSLDFARMLVALTNGPIPATGAFHLTNVGTASWYSLCVEAARVAGLDVTRVRATKLVSVANTAARPKRTILGPGHLPDDVAALNRCWQDALEDYLRRPT